MKIQTIQDFQWKQSDLLNHHSLNSIYLGIEKKNNLMEASNCAIKVIQKDLMQSDDILNQILQQEIQAIKTIEGKNIVKNKNIIDEGNYVYIISRYYKQGNLREYLKKMNDQISEKLTIYIIQNILEGMQTMKKFNYIHRDLKPEYILINNNEFHIYGFGLSRQVEKDEKMDFYAGTPGYMSPQIVLLEQYTDKCDIWSIGCIFYELLTGQQPGHGQNDFEKINDIKNNQLQYPSQLRISQQIRDFINKCLAFDEKDRFSWDQIFKDPLFTNKIQKKTFISEQQNYDYEKPKDTLSVQMINILIDIQNQIQQKCQLKDFYSYYFQKDNIDIDDFKAFLQNFDLDKFDQQELFDFFDYVKDGQITQQEFEYRIVQTNYTDKLDNQQLSLYKAKSIIKNLKNLILKNNLNIERIFQQYNTNSDDSLDQDEFYQLLLKVDRNITENEAYCCFLQFDVNCDKLISLKEFTNVLQIQNINNSVMQYYEEKKDMKLFAQSQNLINKIKQLISKYDLDLKLIFINFDENVEGYLNYDQFNKFLQTIEPYVTQQIVNNIFVVLQDENQRIQYDEFYKIFN